MNDEKLVATIKAELHNEFSVVRTGASKRIAKAVESYLASAGYVQLSQEEREAFIFIDAVHGENSRLTSVPKAILSLSRRLASSAEKPQEVCGKVCVGDTTQQDWSARCTKPRGHDSGENPTKCGVKD